MDVILKRINDYNYEILENEINNIFNYFHFLDNLSNDKKVFIKLNCVGPFSYEMGITTHPIILDVVLKIITKYTNNIVVGDNPAVRDINFTLKKCGLLEVIKKYNVSILKGNDVITIENKNAKTYNKFEVSKEMIEADYLINLPKIKTHSLAYMTCAEKNFFGLIYGLNKSAWHTKANNPLDFGEAINDLYGAFLNCYNKNNIIHIADGIVGLEGEGPSTGGFAKSANAIIASSDAISVDTVACFVCGLDYNKLFITQIGAKRGYGEGDINNIKLIGNNLNDFNDIKFLAPRDSLSNIGLRILQIKFFKNILLEHPKINKDKCIKCGECTRICPVKTMQIKNKKYPTLKPINCIRCWCCQEVCPQNAISKTNKPLLGKIFLK